MATNVFKKFGVPDPKTATNDEIKAFYRKRYTPRPELDSGTQVQTFVAAEGVRRQNAEDAKILESIESYTTEQLHALATHTATTAQSQSGITPNSIIGDIVNIGTAIAGSLVAPPGTGLIKAAKSVKEGDIIGAAVNAASGANSLSNLPSGAIADQATRASQVDAANELRGGATLTDLALGGANIAKAGADIVTGGNTPTANTSADNSTLPTSGVVAPKQEGLSTLAKIGLGAGAVGLGAAGISALSGGATAPAIANNAPVVDKTGSIPQPNAGGSTVADTFGNVLNIVSKAGTALGVVGTAYDLLTGASKDAAVEAARLQTASIDKAIASNEKLSQEIINEQRRAEDVTRGDLEPFRKAGEAQLQPLANDIQGVSNLVNDPNAQKEFVTENPFFNALADDAQRRIFNNQAARGKIGSGSTAEALQNSLLLLGPDLVNQNINQRNSVIGNRQSLANLGQNSAARTGAAAQNTANSIGNTLSNQNRSLTDLTTNRGDVNASSVVAAQNARTQSLDQLINVGVNI